MRSFAVDNAFDTNLTITTRICRNGVLDKARSSRQVHGSNMAVGTQFRTLGWLDLDALNPEPQGRLKILGSFRSPVVCQVSIISHHFRR
jgi:hypothetical protein